MLCCVSSCIKKQWIIRGNMSGVRRTEDLFSIKTKQVIMQNYDGSFPAQYGVLNVKDDRGHIVPSSSINLQRLDVIDLSASTIFSEVTNATPFYKPDYSANLTVNVNNIRSSYIDLLGLLCSRGIIVDTLVWNIGDSNIPLGPGGTGYSVIYDLSNGSFIATGTSLSNARSTISYSAFGAGWSDVLDVSFTTCYTVSTIPSINRLLATGANSGGMNIALSVTSGPQTWRTDISGVPFGIGGYGKTIAYSNTRLVVGGFGAGTRPNICYSDASDGVVWLDAQGAPFGVGSSSVCNDILYDPSAQLFIAVGKGFAVSRNIFISRADGMLWRDISNSLVPFGYGSSGGCGNSVTYNPVGPVYVAGGKGVEGEANMLYSTDGNVWFNAKGNPFDSLGECYKVVFIATPHNIFIAVGKGRSNICYSMNGMTWTDALGTPFGANGYGMDIVYNPPTKRFIASGNGTNGRSNVCYSNDGITWKDVKPGSNGEIINPFGVGGAGNALAYDPIHDIIVLVGGGATNGATVYYS